MDSFPTSWDVNSYHDASSHQRLVQSFEDVADHYNIEKIPGFKQKFPKEFSLCHVVEIWKYTAKYQEKLRRRRAF